jgi:hypothetical protein
VSSLYEFLDFIGDLLIIDQESKAVPQSNFSPKTENSSCFRSVGTTVSDVTLSRLEMDWSDMPPSCQVSQNSGELAYRRRNAGSYVECITVALFAL